MRQHNQIRADYDDETIVVYQAYGPRIAIPALEAQRFVTPFSFKRMTWIKPSFRWMMHRSGWGTKPDQECILAVRITREGWEQALALGVLTSYEPRVYRSHQDWRDQISKAIVNVQWDPERTIHGKPQKNTGSIQVGLSHHIVPQYVQHWIVEIRDYTPLVQQMRELLARGKRRAAKKLLPAERVYPVSFDIAHRLLIDYPARQ